MAVYSSRLPLSGIWWCLPLSLAHLTCYFVFFYHCPQERLRCRNESLLLIIYNRLNNSGNCSKSWSIRVNKSCMWTSRACSWSVCVLTVLSWMMTITMVVRILMITSKWIRSLRSSHMSAIRSSYRTSSGSTRVPRCCEEPLEVHLSSTCSGWAQRKGERKCGCVRCHHRAWRCHHRARRKQTSWLCQIHFQWLRARACRYFLDNEHVGFSWTRYNSMNQRNRTIASPY